MPGTLSKEEVDKKLTVIAHKMKEQWNDLSHNRGMGHDHLMVCADRKIVHLRYEWDKTLLSHEIVCDSGRCKKVSPISQWKFFYGRIGHEPSIEELRMKCPRCGFAVWTSEHSMHSRILWIVNHAFAPFNEFLPGFTNDHKVFYSKTTTER